MQYRKFYKIQNTLSYQMERFNFIFVLMEMRVGHGLILKITEQ